MPHISDIDKRQTAQIMVKLGNERSRVKHALQYTWDAFGISKDDQAQMLQCILDGNGMDTFEAIISQHGQRNGNSRMGGRMEH